MNRIVDQSKSFSWSAVAAVGLLAAALTTTGCTGNTPPQFRLNMQGRNPDDFVITGREQSEARESLLKMKPDASQDEIKQRAEGRIKQKKEFIAGRQAIADSLYAMFGTPDEPYVFPESGLDIAKLKQAAGPVQSDKSGAQRGLYRQHCVHCHGISGDGAGPTAVFLHPYPRDYRKGLYKFKSTVRNARPSVKDLERIIRDGIPGTAMPSFALLPSDEVAALVEYVRYLSIRGEVETALATQVFDSEEPLDVKRGVLVETMQPIADQWANADKQLLAVPARPPVDTPEKLAKSIAEGKKIFLDARSQCTKCHGPTALGDGSELALFDDWNKDKKQTELRKQIADAKAVGSPVDKLERQLAISTETWLLPEQELKPRNLRLGIFRFGRSPADLYRRISAGINGTPMPSSGQANPGGPVPLKETEIWNLVDYIRSLPYETASQTHAAEASSGLMHK
jgi:mono/diheme cytochrome c family protein